MDSIIYMVSEGTPHDGFKFYGPFATNIQAESWAMARENNGFWWIHTVERPTFASDTMRVHAADWVSLIDVCDALGLDDEAVWDTLDAAGVTWGGTRGEMTMISLARLCAILNVTDTTRLSRDTLVYIDG